MFTCFFAVKVVREWGDFMKFIFSCQAHALFFAVLSLQIHPLSLWFQTSNSWPDSLTTWLSLRTDPPTLNPPFPSSQLNSVNSKVLSMFFLFLTEWHTGLSQMRILHYACVSWSWIWFCCCLTYNIWPVLLFAWINIKLLFSISNQFKYSLKCAWNKFLSQMSQINH